MARANGKSDQDPERNERGAETTLDVEHELPAGEGDVSQISLPVEDYERLKQERDALLDRAARLQAEFDNFRKRNLREQQEFRDYALADAVKQLLPIVDSFDRALQATGLRDEFYSGIQLINKQFHDALAKLGVEPVPAQGAPFDPNVHQAIELVDTEKAEDNHVIEELQRGYRIKDRLLRPAMVRVAHNPGKK